MLCCALRRARRIATNECGCGGTGRRAGFRYPFLTEWGFDSLQPHQSLAQRMQRSEARQNWRAHSAGEMTAERPAWWDQQPERAAPSPYPQTPGKACPPVSSTKRAGSRYADPLNSHRFHGPCDWKPAAPGSLGATLMGKFLRHELRSFPRPPKKHPRQRLSYGTPLTRCAALPAAADRSPTGRE